MPWAYSTSSRSGSGLLGKTDRAQAESGHLCEGLLPAGGFELALSHHAIRLQRFVLEKGHGCSKIRNPNWVRVAWHELNVG